MSRYIAARTAQFNSDARFAIRLLRNAACDLERDRRRKITKDHVNAAFRATKTEIERDMLGRLGTSRLLVLLAVSRAAAGLKKKLLTVRSVHQDTYRALCESHGRKPLVYSQFLSIIRGLQNYDLVNDFLERRAAGGFIRRVEVNFDPNSVESVAKKVL